MRRKVFRTNLVKEIRQRNNQRNNQKKRHEKIADKIQTENRSETLQTKSPQEKPLQGKPPQEWSREVFLFREERGVLSSYSYLSLLRRRSRHFSHQRCRHFLLPVHDIPIFEPTKHSPNLTCVFEVSVKRSALLAQCGAYTVASIGVEA